MSRKYCDLPDTPLFTFGEGLSYTQFTYSDLRVDEHTLLASVTVENTGEREGLETAQVYFRDCVSSVLTPVRQLSGWRQIKLLPKEKKEIHFQFSPKDFSLVNKNGERITEPGEFELMIGHSAKDGDLLKIRFTL